MLKPWFDMLCLQETKANAEDVKNVMELLPSRSYECFEGKTGLFRHSYLERQSP